MPLIIDLGLKEQVNKLGLGLFDPKLYRLVKWNGKTENYSILTRVLLKAAPRPSSPRAATAQRLGGPRPTTTRRPGGQVLIFHNLLSAGKSTRMHRSASGLAVQTLNLVTIFIIIWIVFDPFFRCLLLSEKRCHSLFIRLLTEPYREEVHCQTIQMVKWYTNSNSPSSMFTPKPDAGLCMSVDLTLSKKLWKIRD